MSELFHTLGLDWKLLLAQAVNFIVLLALLHKFAYKPLLKVLKDRRMKIEEGLAKAEEADARLKDADVAAKHKIHGAEEEALGMLRMTEEKAKKMEAELLSEARKKEAALLANADRVVKAKEEEGNERLRSEAGELIRRALVKAVGLKPEAIDEALIKTAVEEMKRAS